MNESLNADKEYKAQLEENFLKHIGYEHVENLCTELDSQKEYWKDIEVPESLDQWFNDFHKQEENRRSKRSKNASVIRFMKRAAVVILFIIGINYFLITTVEAYRIQFFKAVVSIQESFTQIDYESNNPGSVPDLSDAWIGMYYFSYLPKGYTLTENDMNKYMAELKYMDEDGNLIVLQQYFENSSLIMNSEEGIVTNIIINNEKATLVEKGSNLKIVSWLQYDRAFYLLTYNTKLPEIVKMAESIKIKK